MYISTHVQVSNQAFFHYGSEVFIVDETLVVDKYNTSRTSRWIYMIQEDSSVIQFMCITTGIENQVCCAILPPLSLYLSLLLSLSLSLSISPFSSLSISPFSSLYHSLSLSLSLSWSHKKSFNAEIPVRSIMYLNAKCIYYNV